MTAQAAVRWNGTTYRTLLTSADTGGLSVIWGAADPLTGPPTHVHAGEDEIFIVLEGEIEFDVAGRRLHCGPLDAAVVPRGTPHSFRTGPDGARCLTILTPGGFEGFFAEMAAGDFRIPRDITAIVAAAARYGSHMAGPGIAGEV